MPTRSILLYSALFAGLISQAYSQAASFPERPGMAKAEELPASVATCDTVKRSLAGLPEPSTRIDLWIRGNLTLAYTDGVLWYLAVCSSPNIRVMCVTYEGNGMKVGDRVTLRGGYNRQDQTHVVLDPCLAARS